jgi:hypothetical protein
MKAAFLAVAVLATAGVVFYFSTTVRAAKASGPGSAEQRSTGHRSAEQGSDAHSALASKALSLPLFFEPNQGQTAPQVKFLARGSGYGLFLTADEAVLQLQRAVANPRTATAAPERPASSVIRMKLAGANSAARVSGAEPLPGKSNYFIGNNPAKWRRNIPQFARVQYKSVYPGVDLVYYGDQGQLEYDFRVAPAADPNQIALGFQGASTHLDAGDLVLSTANGDVRFHAPHVYQPAAPGNAQNNSGSAETTVAGSFRQLADNKIGFTIADYDHSRELVIDPVLSYSTYLGGTGSEGLVKIAVDGAGLVYVAGSTNSAYFFPPITANPPIQGKLGGTNAQNIFIAVIDPHQQINTNQLVWATYIGGSQIDSLAGVAVDSALSIYVAGSTTSPDFPTTSSALLTSATGAHGFLSRISLGDLKTYTLGYSTYLAGNGVDTVTGLAIDASQQYAYVTGVTTSTNVESDAAPFPANSKGYQTSNPDGTPLFFASQINTTGTGTGSMIYSTYFGGGNFAAGITVAGGGIAVDTTPSNVSMYFTGTTNMLQTTGSNGQVKFPLLNAQQACLDAASTTSCSSAKPINPDAFLAKINPNPSGGFGSSSLVYSTYLGGSGSETGAAVDVDSSGNAYVIGSTNSTDWTSAGSGFQTALGGGFDAFIAKIGALNGSGVYPLNYFTYLGGNGDDFGQDIKVDGVQTVHVTGTTSSTNFPTTPNTYQPSNHGLQDAFVASISTTSAGTPLIPNGDYSTYLGGSQQDQGTGVAVDIFGATYVAGTTQSSNFPIPPPPAPPPYQGQLNGPQDAFISKIGSSSILLLANPTTSPAPNPVPAGTQVAFTFDILNTGPDNASDVIFNAIVPSSGLVVGSVPSAKVTQGSGSCGPVSGGTISCRIPSLAICVAPCTAGTAVEAAVEVDVTPAINTGLETISVSANVSANGGGTQAVGSQIANVVDFTITPSPALVSIAAGDIANFKITFKPSSNLGYNATITPTQTTSPSIVTSSITFTPPTVSLSGSSSESTTLSIATVARPVTTGSLLRRGSFYATWLPIGGLSLVALGIGTGRKRRRWLAGAVLGLIAGAMLLQSSCGSSSSSINPSGGTQAGTYIITIHGSAAAGAAHDTTATLVVS